jgi:hypothetical protein
MKRNRGHIKNVAEDEKEDEDDDYVTLTFLDTASVL